MLVLHGLGGGDEDFEKESESNRKATKEAHGIDDVADIFGNAAQDFRSVWMKLIVRKLWSEWKLCWKIKSTKNKSSAQKN